MSHDPRPTRAAHLEECRLLSLRLIEDNNSRAEVYKHHASIWVPAPMPTGHMSATNTVWT